MAKTVALTPPTLSTKFFVLMGINVKGVEHQVVGILDKKAMLVANPQEIPTHWGNYATVN